MRHCLKKNQENLLILFSKGKQIFHFISKTELLLKCFDVCLLLLFCITVRPRKQSRGLLL